jgi:UDP-glucose 4-epimerase
MISRSERPPVLVFGGRGFVGAAAVRRLLADGDPVHVFGPESAVRLPADAAEIPGSIEDAGAVAAAISRLRPGVVVSFAAFSAGPIGLGRSGEADPERTLAVNVLGFRRMLDACVTAGVRRVIWTSSTVVFGRAADSTVRLAEEAPRRPLVVYGLSKVLAEDVARYYRDRHGLETVALRIPLMLGPGLWYDGAASALKSMVAAAAPGAAPVFAVPDAAFDAMHVEDAADLVAALRDAPAGLAAVYNVAGFTTTYQEIVAELAALVPGYRPSLAPQRPEIVYPLVSQALLERDIGWRHRRGLRQILADMLAERRNASP